MPFFDSSRSRHVRASAALSRFRDEAEFLFHRMLGARSSQNFVCDSSKVHINTSFYQHASWSRAIRHFRYSIRINRGMPQSNCDFDQLTHGS